MYYTLSPYNYFNCLRSRHLPLLMTQTRTALVARDYKLLAYVGKIAIP